MTRSIVASLAIALAAVVAACSASTPPPSAGPPATVSPSGRPPAAAASANPCVTAVDHLAAFAGRLGGQLAELRPLVIDPAFDSSATAAAIRQISSTITAFAGLEDRLAPCPPTAPLAERVRALRQEARASIDASTSVSIRDQVTQRAVAAALFGLLPEVESIATATDQAAVAAGIDTDVALVPGESSKPLGSLPPLATQTPRPTVEPPPDVSTYGSAFFGANSTVKTYTVSGDTPLEIVSSMLARGPENSWLHERAEALTLAIPHVNVQLSGEGSSCRVVTRSTPSVFFSFTVTLPRWVPSSGVKPATVTWWNSELGRAATHENHHVALWRAAGARMAKAVGTSSCGNLQSRLAAIVKETTRANCEFDMEEYGEALGLSLEECVAR